MSHETPPVRGFWESGAPATATDVLNALRHFRDAELRAHQRACDELGVGENGLHALRFLLEADDRGEQVNAKDVAIRLGVTAASTSALIDRLVRSGYIERTPDPDDRRGVRLGITGPAAHRARRVISELDDRRRRPAAELEADAADIVVRFLTEMTVAVAEEDSVPAGMDKSS